MRQIDRVIYLVGASLWVLIGTWVIAPLIAWGLAFTLLTVFRGFEEAVVLLHLICLASRWCFLFIAIMHFCCTVWKPFATSLAKRLVHDILASLALYVPLYALCFVSWMKLFITFQSRDPVSVLSLEQLSLGWESFGIMIFYWEPVLSFVQKQTRISLLYLLYTLFKLTYAYFGIGYVARRLYATEASSLDAGDVFHIALLIVLVGWVGIVPFIWLGAVPLMTYRDKESFICIQSYEILWLFATIPIGLYYLSIVRRHGT